jgi:hypothetical protein
MTPEQQRSAIADAFPSDIMRLINGLWTYYHSGSGKWQRCLENDPLCDMNVIHETEKTITDEQTTNYAVSLWAMTGSPIFATPAQRWEALLRCLNLWTE